MYDYICLKCGCTVTRTEKEYEQRKQNGEENLAYALYDLSEPFYRNGFWSEGFLPVYFGCEELKNLLDDKDGMCDGTKWKKVTIRFRDFAGSVGKYMNLEGFSELTYEDVEDFLEASRTNDTTGDGLFAETEDVFANIGLDNPTEQPAQDAPVEEKNPELSEMDAYKVFVSQTKQATLRALVGDSPNETERMTHVTTLYRNVCAAFSEKDSSGERVCRFEIKINLENVDNQTNEVYWYRKDEYSSQKSVLRCLEKEHAENARYGIICSNPVCRMDEEGQDTSFMEAMPIFQYAWKYRHIAVGFIGRPSSGKTCLITGLWDYLRNDRQTPIIFKGNLKNNKNMTKALGDFSQHRRLPKTPNNGRTGFNVTVFINNNTILTLVDIAGECFDFTTGTFMAENAKGHFAMISRCQGYVICLDPSKDWGDENGANSVGAFMEHLAGEHLKPVPYYLTITKYDETDEALQSDINDGQQDMEKSRGKLCKYPFYRGCLPKLIEKFKSFVGILDENAYYTTGVCSAYGGIPKPAGTPVRIETIKSYLQGGQKMYICDNGTYFCGTYDLRDLQITEVLEANEMHIIAEIPMTELENVKIRFDEEGKSICAAGVDLTEAYDFITDARELLITAEMDNTLTLSPEPAVGGSIYLKSSYSDDRYRDEVKHLKEMCDWIFMVTGLREIEYCEIRRNDSYLDNYGATVDKMYRFNDTDCWDYNCYRTDARSITLADCAIQLFVNERPFDRYLSANRYKTFDLMKTAATMKFSATRDLRLKAIEKDYPDPPPPEKKQRDET